MFRGCKTEDMPPHVYSLAQTAYRSLVETRRDQSLIFMGRSGSGKSTSFKHALNYLALAAGMRFHSLIVVVAPTHTRVAVAFVVCFPFGRRLRAAGWPSLRGPHQNPICVRLAHLHCWPRNAAAIRQASNSVPLLDLSPKKAKSQIEM